jgi:3-hydroxyisobutyrate dehydrogenase-like beta-hydroxyacid dehydrogenase
MAPARTVGLAGLGLVGNALANRLRAAGWNVIGYDVHGEACEAFRATGGQVAASPQALGRAAETVLLAVFDTRDVLSVLEGPDGVLSAGHAVRAAIDCSTGDPALLEPLARRLAAQGIDFIEAPLSGSSRQIADGEATMLLGGGAAAVARAEALLSALAAQRVHVGAAGMGAKAKLATNLVLGLNRAVLAEGMAFAEGLGIAPAQFLQLVLASPARSVAAEVKGPLMVSEDFTPQSRIRQHLKDVELMLESARGAGVALPLSTTHAQLMRDAVAAGDGELDNAAILRQIRRAGANTRTPGPQDA